MRSTIRYVGLGLVGLFGLNAFSSALADSNDMYVNNNTAYTVTITGASLNQSASDPSCRFSAANFPTPVPAGGSGVVGSLTAPTAGSCALNVTVSSAISATFNQHNNFVGNGNAGAYKAIKLGN